MTLIESEEHRVLYTGDFCNFDQLTVKGADIPSIKIDTLICESTYAYNTSSGPINLSRTASAINAVLEKTDTFVCTNKNAGRPAEIAAAVLECMRLGMIPEFDIMIDAGCLEVCKACEKWGEYKIFGEHAVRFEAYRPGMILTGRALNWQYNFSPMMSNHADSFGILDLISRVKPDKVILVHGVPQENSTHNVPIEIRERFGDSVEAVHSTNGRTINLFRE